MPSPWTPAADIDLLLAIIDENKLQGLDWHVIAAKMATKKHKVSHEGCRYVICLYIICNQHNFTAFICHSTTTAR